MLLTMEVSEKTHRIFIELKYGLVHMATEELLYNCPSSDDLIFFYPNKNKIALHKILGRDTDKNMPIINMTTPNIELTVKNNEDVKIALEIISGDINK